MEIYIKDSNSEEFLIITNTCKGLLKSKKYKTFRAITSEEVSDYTKKGYKVEKFNYNIPNGGGYKIAYLAPSVLNWLINERDSDGDVVFEEIKIDPELFFESYLTAKKLGQNFIEIDYSDMKWNEAEGVYEERK